MIASIKEKRNLAVTGALIGIIAVVLMHFGNPGNMGFCIACFIRDIAGSLNLHNASAVQYMRPEIIGIVLGSFIISVMKGEFKPRSGSSPIIRFMLGFFMMVGALVFLGCPLRMVLRLAAGDLNALVGLFGFIAGIGIGAFFLNNGFSLGRARTGDRIEGVAFPFINIVLLFILLFFPTLLKFSESGPGSMHAPIILSLIGGLVFGIFAQKSRMCFAGSIRDVILMKNFDLLTIIGSFFVVMLIYNIATGNFTLAFDTPGIIAHSEHLWNILGMYAVGFAAVLAGGCPLRQLILAGEGNGDSAVTVGGLCIIGRDDRSNPRRRSVAELVRGADRSKYIIIMDHQPYHLERAERAGADFQLSGHTHHGQLWPISWITEAVYECAYGPWRRGHTRYYVSSGMGIWGGKFRIGTRSEYVVATIVRQYE